MSSATSRHGRHPRRLREQQRGLAALLFTASALGLVVAIGFALDLGLVYVRKASLQNALDAAALSGAKTLNATSSVADAEASALAAFNLNMPGSGITPTITTSATLLPFVNGSADPRFLKVQASAVPVTAYLLRALPGIGETLTIGGTSVAGRIPVGGVLCGATPVAICGTPGDADCSDGSCYGLGVGGSTETTFIGDNTGLGPGNYGYVELVCGSGAACLREGMAGGQEVCFNETGTVPTKPGVNTGPASQGLNTRFGIYSGPVSSSEYRSDLVTATGIFFDEYQSRLANHNYDNANGVALRRLVLMPVIDCSVPINGATNVSVLGPMCVFLTQPMSNPGGEVVGQIIGSCPATGGVPEDPDPDASGYEIQLFQDPDGVDA